MTKLNDLLHARRILVAIGGGIAAYKVCDLVSRLFQRGAEIRVLLTDSAQAFITPLTVATLSRHAAYTDADFWQSDRARPLHIELGEWAELILIAPLTANTLGKLAGGLADNLLTNTILASRCPVLLAPAMNTEMWEQVSVQRNWQILLEDDRYFSVGPRSGLLACDRVGAGRMAEPSEILSALESWACVGVRRDLAGKHVLISAGGTREYLDPVRFIGNPSTGKMGVAIARAARYRGATVTLVGASLSESLLSDLADICYLPVTRADELDTAMRSALPDADWIVMAAAVGDVQPESYSPHKLPKSELPAALPLKPASDIVAGLSALKRPEQVLVGFAAQTGDILTPALEKLKRKNLDAIVANPVDRPDAGFGSETNQAIIVDRNGRQVAIAPCSKLQLAHRLLDFIEPYSA